MRRMPAKINESGVEIVPAGLATAVAFAIAVAFANVLLLPLRAFLTGAVTATVIDQCRYKELSFEPSILHTAYLVRTRGSSDFISIATCDPKVTGDCVTVIDSKIAATTVAVRGDPTLIKIYLGLDGPAGSSFMVVLLLGCGLTLV
jgi:hypothetical protein